MNSTMNFKGFCFLAMILSQGFFSAAQSVTSANVFEQKKLTWYGLNFSVAKMVGPFNQYKDLGSKSAEDIKNTYFEAWNNVILKESEKYNLPKFFHVDVVDVDLKHTSQMNQNVHTDHLMEAQLVTRHISGSELKSLVETYACPKDGIGVVLFVEEFNKITEKGIVTLVYFEEKTGHILFSTELEGKAGGFGLKNYWVKSIYHILDSVGKTKWKKWKKNASK